MLSKSQLEMIRVKNSKKNGQLKKLKRPPKWLEPLNAERGYIKSLFSYTFLIRRSIVEILLPKIPLWLTLGTRENPVPVKNDDLMDDILESLEDVLNLIDQILDEPEQIAINSAKKAGVEIAVFNKRQFNKTVDNVLGVDIFVEEPWLEGQLDIFASQNAELITGMTDDELKRVSGIVQRGLQEGSSYSSIEENIYETFGITRRKARLIARDQTSKLNASLTKLRQQELGITEYVWQTSGDERVRKTHRPLDGKICRWDDPTVYKNEKNGKWLKRSSIGGTNVHVGVDINCRCQALPEIEGMF